MRSRDIYFSRNGPNGRIFTDMGDIVGGLDRAEYPDVEWVSAVKTPHLQEWAELVRYCYSHLDYPCVDVGIISPDRAPKPLIVAGLKEQDHVVSVAPNLHTHIERRNGHEQP